MRTMRPSWTATTVALGALSSSTSCSSGAGRFAPFAVAAAAAVGEGAE